jgi:cytochrome c-type biogenesis protein CcmF
LFLVLLIHVWIIAMILLWLKHRRRKFNSQAVVGIGQKFVALNNWLMVLLTFVIFIGTLFPFFSGLFTEQKISLKASYFTKITAPGGLALLLLLGMCPHLLRHGINRSWRIIGAAIAAITALAIWLISHKIAPACFIFCAFAALNLGADFLSGHIKIRRRKNEQPAPRRSLRWYGARIVHVGVVLVFIGIAGSGGYGTEENAALRPNDRISVAGFDITFDGLKADHGPNFTAVTADISVHKGQKLIAKLSPSQAYYTRSDKRTSEVDIRRTLAYDLYVALAEVNKTDELINLKVLFKPLINWIWIGSVVMIFGIILISASLYTRKTIASQGKGEGTK